MEKKNQIHLNYLDGLRAITAVYVVLHHLVLMTPAGQASSFTRIMGFPFQFGRYAVDTFIVLSGFCLMLPTIKNENKLVNGSLNFYWKRTKRILPTYYAAIGLSLLLIYTIIGAKTNTLWDGALPVQKADIINHVLLIQDMFPDSNYKINYPLWSISVEWRIYFFFPLILFLWRKSGALSTTLMVTCISMALWLLVESGRISRVPVGNNPQYLGLFTIGMLSAQIAFSKAAYFSHLRNNVNWKGILLACLAALVLLYLGIAGNNKFFLYIFGENSKYSLGAKDISVAVLICSLLILLQSGKLKPVYRVLSYKPIVFTGTFAYSIYLIHAPFLQVIHQYIIAPLHLSSTYSTIVYFMISPVIIFIAYVFYLVAERPFINRFNQKPTAKNEQLSPSVNTSN